VLLFVLPLVVLGCFFLMSKGFGEDGIPFTEKKRITGNAGKVLGVLCGLLGLVFAVLWFFTVKGSLI
jgi:hypothetical protein